MTEDRQLDSLIAALGQSPVTDPDALWVRVRSEMARPVPAARRRPVRPWLVAAAILVSGVGGASVGLLLHYRAPARWTIEGGGMLAAGDRLEAERQTVLAVGKIGTVTLETGTRVRRIAGGLLEHRLTLERGTMHAIIAAPPRLFIVETPSAVATDLGCAYTLEVGEDGSSRLHVTAGWVELRDADAVSVVSAGLIAEVREGHRPGTPYPYDFPDAARAALHRIDADSMLAGDLDLVMDAMSAPTDVVTFRQRSGITLWHLLPRVAGSDRARVYDRLTALAPPPSDVTREGILSLDRPMLEHWRHDLNPMWSDEAQGLLGRLSRRVWDLVTR